jgi:hypothetical protein
VATAYRSISCKYVDTLNVSDALLADRIASPTKAARYNPAAIIAESNLASERRVTSALAAAPLGYLLAELERRGVRLTA